MVSTVWSLVLKINVQFLRTQWKITSIFIMKKFTCTVWHKIVVAVYFCGFAIFCVLRELIFAIRIEWFILIGINFCNFQKVTQYPALIIFLFLFSTCHRNTYFQTIPYVKPVIRGIPFCYWMKEATCNWTDMIS